MLYRTVMSAACTALPAGAAFAQAQGDLPASPGRWNTLHRWSLPLRPDRSARMACAAIG